MGNTKPSKQLARSELMAPSKQTTMAEHSAMTSEPASESAAVETVISSVILAPADLTSPSFVAQHTFVLGRVALALASPRCGRKHPSAIFSLWIKKGVTMWPGPNKP